MKRRIARWPFLALFYLLAFRLPDAALRAQTESATDDPKLAAEDKEGCIRNLKLIYEAIQAYEMDHKNIPNWLSDLVPQYINDANILTCPACKRTGQSESGPLADPKIPSSYFYEFCPVPLGPKELPPGLERTRRDWKRRQMGLLGSVVPLVRCPHHGVVLNLAFDGHIYESPPDWKPLFTNVVNAADLSSIRIFSAEANNGAAAAGFDAAPKADSAADLIFRQRDPHTKTNLLNLGEFYNAMLTQPWLAGEKDDLSSLPSGVQSFGGVEFDVRGIVQLGGKGEAVKQFPKAVRNIRVRRKCFRVVFLHAAAFGGPADDGRQIGNYVLRFTTNPMHFEIPIFYGQEVRNWRAVPGEKPYRGVEPTIAWTGAGSDGQTLRLYQTIWTNVVPDLEIKSIDFVSSIAAPAPFLIGITAE